MVNLLLLLLIPLIISSIVLVYFKGRDTIPEFLLQIGAVAVVMGLGLALCYVGRTSDTELLNGQVESKERLVVSCRSGGNRAMLQMTTTCGATVLERPPVQ